MLTLPEKLYSIWKKIQWGKMDALSNVAFTKGTGYQVFTVLEKNLNILRCVVKISSSNMYLLNTFIDKPYCCVNEPSEFVCYMLSII